eukprot:GHVP01046114.1.p1 GENE.GHVP01046114.1~~GHVP01046114.1.p1  ORF type:complete len:238 (+),score=33.23 GHVP01046114.1:102-716(+)
MAVFCTWTKPYGTNHIEVLVSTPTNSRYKTEIPKLLSTDTRKLRGLPSIKYKLIPFDVGPGYTKTEKGFSEWVDHKNEDYSVVEQPNFLQFPGEQPLKTWIKFENEVIIEHYCMVGATVFKFQQFKDYSSNINAYITKAGPFLKRLQYLRRDKYFEVLGQLRNFDKDDLAYWEYDISDQNVDFHCEQLQSFLDQERTSLMSGTS